MNACNTYAKELQAQTALQIFVSKGFCVACNETADFIVDSEYYPGCKFGEIIDGVRNEDIEHLSFVDNTFDLMASNDVMEHIPILRLAFGSVREF